VLIGLSIWSMSTPFYLHYHLANAIVSTAAFFNSLVILMLGAYFCFFQGYRQARYFLIAWVVFLIGVGVFLLKQHAILPTNWLTANCIGLGQLLQVVLLSLAQADTLNSLKNEVSLLLEEKSQELSEVQEELKEKYAKSRLDDETLDRYADKLIEYMDSEAPYLDGNLTLASLARAMSFQQSYLSQVLNIRLEKNFHAFVSDYRLSYFKKQLERPENRSKSILDLAYQAGFNSKSSFNTAFKKQENITPSEFRKQRAEAAGLAGSQNLK
jgi:AraC-like DNA-binding protein